MKDNIIFTTFSYKVKQRYIGLWQVWAKKCYVFVKVLGFFYCKGTTFAPNYHSTRSVALRFLRT